MAEIARRTTAKNNRVLFLIHRKEVLDQAVKTFKEQGVNMNLLTAGMVQTLTRKVEKILPPNLILIDEAHHAISKSYQRILNNFPNSYVLFFTATPIRTGKKQLDLIADDIIVGQSIKELTKKHFLAPFDYYSIDDIDSKKLKKSSTGDYTNQSMDEAVSRKIYGHVVENYKRLANGKQAVVFTYSIDSAKKIAQEFNKVNITACELDGTAEGNYRDKIVKQFRAKKIRVLVNVNLFTEGVDLPDVDCVIMTRPTQSLALYLQFSMRCLNPRPGKKAIIIDHVANWKRFGLPDSDRDWKNAIKTTGKKTRKNNTAGGPAIIQCDYCFAVLEAATVKDGQCPMCGNPIKVDRKNYEVVDSNLIKIDHQKKQELEHRKNVIKETLFASEPYQAVMGKSISELKNYREFQIYGEIHNFKKGWSYYQAKMRGMIK